MYAPYAYAHPLSTLQSQLHTCQPSFFLAEALLDPFLKYTSQRNLPDEIDLYKKFGLPNLCTDGEACAKLYELLVKRLVSFYQATGTYSPTVYGVKLPTGPVKINEQHLFYLRHVSNDHRRTEVDTGHGLRALVSTHPDFFIASQVNFF